MNRDRQQAQLILHTLTSCLRHQGLRAQEPWDTYQLSTFPFDSLHHSEYCPAGNRSERMANAISQHQISYHSEATHCKSTHLNGHAKTVQQLRPQLAFLCSATASNKQSGVGIHVMWGEWLSTPQLVFLQHNCDREAIGQEIGHT